MSFARPSVPRRPGELALRRGVASCVALALALAGCGSETANGDGANGGTSAGAAGTSSGGAAGTSSGGASGAAGSSTGGSSTGGSGGQAESTLRIHYHAEPTQRVALRGEGAGLSWERSLPLEATSAGVWEFTLQGQTEAAEFKPVLEDDSGALSWPKGAAFSNWRLLPGRSLDVYPSYVSEQGSLEHFLVEHPEAGPRQVVVYLPPSYAEPGARDKRYPVLVLQDGQNLFDDAALFGGWQLEASLNQLLTHGRLFAAGAPAWEGGSTQELIVVGVYNAGSGRIVEYTPTNASFSGCDAEHALCGGGGPDYLQFVVGSVLTEVRARYRVQSTRAGFGGSSLGGLLALSACWTHSESFGTCLVHSPSLWWDDSWALSQLVTGPGPGDPVRLYLDAGTQSDGLELVRQLNQYLLGVGFTSSQSSPTENNLWCLEGLNMGHNELAWAERAPWAIYQSYADTNRVQPPPVLPSSLRPCE